MNDCGEVQKNAGTAPISAAAEYGRDGRMTSGLNGVRGYISDCNPSQITDYLLRGVISRSRLGLRKIQTTGFE